jgi:hypothetical protein
MRITKFDVTTYNQTKFLSTPTYRMVEEEIPEIEMITDENGNPTRGGLIGFYLAYVLMTAFVAYLFLIV